MRGPARILALTALIAGAIAPSAAAEELHVPWSVDGALVGQANPNSPPPGSNDWSCKPSGRHPDPVVLVHGLLANRTTNFSTMSPFLANRGFCVYTLTYGTRDAVNLGVYQPGGLNRMQQSARELKRFVGRVLDATGAEQVDIVGHSEGSLMPNWYVKFLGGDEVVDDYVGVTPLWDGTNTAGLATIDQIGRALGLSQGAYDALAPFCESCPQFLKGSRFMERMSSGGGPRVPGVHYTMIMTRNDELVVPYTSGEMDGAENLVVQQQCPLDQSEHLSIIFDPTTATDIVNALDPKHAKPVPCTLVLPLVGALGYSGN